MGVEFQKDISMAKDLEGLLRLHSTYVSTIFDRCFLNQKVTFVPI